MPNNELTPVQNELLKFFRTNKASLNEENLALLEQLEQKCADLVLSVFSLLRLKIRFNLYFLLLWGTNVKLNLLRLSFYIVSVRHSKIISLQDSMSLGHGEKLHSNSLPLVSQDDLVNILGSAGMKNDYTLVNQSLSTTSFSSVFLFKRCIFFQVVDTLFQIFANDIFKLLKETAPQVWVVVQVLEKR